MYRNHVGSMIYLTNTRPDILYIVSVVSRFMSDPSKLQYATAKRILRYFQGTKNSTSNTLKKKTIHSLVTPTAAGQDGSMTTRVLQDMHYYGIKGDILILEDEADSSIVICRIEVGYIPATSVVYEAIWLRRILSYL